MSTIRRCDFALCSGLYAQETIRHRYCSDPCRAKAHLRKQGKAYLGPAITHQEADRLAVQLNKQAHWKLRLHQPAVLEYIQQQQQELSRLRTQTVALLQQESQVKQQLSPLDKQLKDCEQALATQRKALVPPASIASESIADMLRTVIDTAGYAFSEYTAHQQQQEGLLKKRNQLLCQIKLLEERLVKLQQQRQSGQKAWLEKHLALQKQVRELNWQQPRPRMKKSLLTASVSAVPRSVSVAPTVVEGAASQYRSAAQLMQQPEGALLTLPGHLGRFLGQLERKHLSITLTGGAGSGKTHFSFQLAKAFTGQQLRVLFCSLEMGYESGLFKRHLRHYQLAQEALFFGAETATLASIRENAKEFDVIILDSWTMIEGSKSKDFGELSKQFPELILIGIFQQTASGQPRGGSRPIFDSFINLEVIKGVVHSRKNRYGGQGEFLVFADDQP